MDGRQGLLHDREWQGLQARAGLWLADAERTYAALMQDGAAGAPVLGPTGSEALGLATVTTGLGAEAGADVNGTLAQAAANAVSNGSVIPPVAGSTAVVDPPLDEAGDSIEAGFLPRADGSRAEVGAFDAGVRTPGEMLGARSQESPAGSGAGRGDAAANAIDALERAVAAEAAGSPVESVHANGGGTDAAVADAVAALDRAFASAATAESVEPAAARGGSTSADTAPAEAGRLDPFAALEQAFAAEGADLPADPTDVGDGSDTNAVRADPFAAMEGAFRAKVQAVDAGLDERAPAAPVDGAGGSDAAVDDPFATLERAFASEATGSRPEPVAAGSGGNRAAAVPDAFDALDRAFAVEAAAESTGPAAVEDRNDGSAGGAPADPLAALEQAFATAAVAENIEAEPRHLADAEPAQAAVQAAFVAEAAESSAGEETDADGRPAARADLSAVPEQALVVPVPDEVMEVDGADAVDDARAPATFVVPFEAQVDSGRSAEALAEPVDLAAWVRAVNASVTAAEQAASDAEAAASGAGSWFARAAGCVNSQDRLTSELARIEELTIGRARPSFVTGAAGEEAYAELGARRESARERGRAACESIDRPR